MTRYTLAQLDRSDPMSQHVARTGRLARVSRDERGFSLIVFGCGFMALLAASMLAIDVGMLMHARTQALEAVLALVAHITPRDGEWEASWLAFQERARQVLK